MLEYSIVAIAPAHRTGRSRGPLLALKAPGESLVQRYFREFSCSTHRLVGMWGLVSVRGRTRPEATRGSSRTSARSLVPRTGPGGEGCSSSPVPQRSPASGAAEGVSADPGFPEVGVCGTLPAARTGSTGPKAAPLLVSVKRVLPLGTSPAERARSAAVRAGVKRFEARPLSPATGHGAPTEGRWDREDRDLPPSAAGTSPGFPRKPY